MIETIRKDSDNKVMRNLEFLISKLGEFIVKNIEESSKKDKEEMEAFSITTIDNYDFYAIDKKYVHRKNVFEPETTDEEIYTKTCIRTYMRAFKFLQLLCENNNIDGKNFIRDQKNDLKNYDFIKIAAKEIFKDKIREVRGPLLEAEDVVYMKALEAGDSDAQAASVTAKNALRNAPAASAITNAADIAALKAAWDTDVLGDSPYA